MKSLVEIRIYNKVKMIICLSMITLDHLVHSNDRMDHHEHTPSNTGSCRGQETNHH